MFDRRNTAQSTSSIRMTARRFVHAGLALAAMTLSACSDAGTAPAAPERASGYITTTGIDASEPLPNGADR